MTRIIIQTVDLTKIFKLKSNFLRLLWRRKPGGTCREVRAVDRINLEIREGELFGLLGPNGAGKTTLIKLLCGLLLPTSGTAYLNSFDVKKELPQVKKSIGTLFSIGERGFYWRLSVFRNLEFYAALYNVPRRRRRERINNILDVLGLKQVASEPFQKLSGGMKRKLALARALLPDPPILLLDEPTLHLDATSSRFIRSFIQGLCRAQKKTVLYATNYIEEINRISDRVGIIHQGKIVACGLPDTIRNMIEERNVVELKVQGLSQIQLKTLKKMPFVLKLTSFVEDKTQCMTKLRLQLDDMDSLSPILNYLSKERVKLHGVRKEEPTLEDAFIHLTRS